MRFTIAGQPRSFSDTSMTPRTTQSIEPFDAQLARLFQGLASISACAIDDSVSPADV